MIPVYVQRRDLATSKPAGETLLARFTRVPSVGEIVVLEDALDLWRVTEVIHFAHTEKRAAHSLEALAEIGCVRER